MALIPVVKVQLLETRLPHDAPLDPPAAEGESSQQRQGRSGLRMIVEAAGGAHLADGTVMTGALQLLCTAIGCSAPPLSGRAGLLIASGKPLSSADAGVGGASAGGRGLEGGGAGPLCSWGNLHWDVAPPNSSCRRVWQAIQDLDGIRMLSGLLRGGNELAGQDGIRALACRSLLGLSHEARIRQILQESQLALALTELVKAPIMLLNSRRGTGAREVEAAAFRQAASKLISCVTGRAQDAVLEVAGDSALRKIERAATVEASAIRYDKRELLRLVHAHLASSGLHRAAQVLLEDAGIEALPGVAVATVASGTAGGGAAVSSGDAYAYAAQDAASSSAPKGVGGASTQPLHPHLTTPGPPKSVAVTPRTPALSVFANRTFTPNTGASAAGAGVAGGGKLPHSPPLSPTRARDRPLILVRSPHKTGPEGGGGCAAGGGEWRACGCGAGGAGG